MNELYQWHKPQYVGITKTRWSLVITVVDEQATEHRYIASADSYYTGQDQLWFSIMQEYNEFEG